MRKTIRESKERREEQVEAGGEEGGVAGST